MTRLVHRIAFVLRGGRWTHEVIRNKMGFDSPYIISAAVASILVTTYLLWRRSQGSHPTLVSLLSKPHLTEEKIVQWIISHPECRCQLNDLDREGLAPIMMAARDSRPRVLLALLDLGASLSDTDANGWSPIHHACKTGDRGNTTFLQILNTDPSSISRRNAENLWTPLHVCISVGDTERARKLLSLGATRGEKTDKDFTPLIIASANGHDEIVNILLEKKEDCMMEDKAGPYRRTALGFATMSGHLSIVRRLLESGANITATNSAGGTPLHDAAAKGHVDIIRLMIASPDAHLVLHTKKSDGNTPSHEAALRGHSDALQLLVQAGASVSDVDQFGQTVLHMAARNGERKMVEQLLRCGAEVNSLDYDGYSALHKLVQGYIDGKEGREEAYVTTADLLFSHGAIVDHSGEDRCTALHIAACRERERAFFMVQYLLSKGADPTYESSIGWSSLHYAASSDGYPPSFNLLRKKIAENSPLYLDSFDAKKPRQQLKRRLRNNLSQEERTSVLGGQVDVEGIARGIREGRFKKVVILTGAGISVSAGIPDFRSPNGIYSKEVGGRYGMTDPAKAFDLAQLHENPKPFFSICRDIFYPVRTGAIKPTPMHKLIRLFQEKGVLLRNYTQNIDVLESAAGIAEEKVICAHGSFASGRCMSCNRAADMEDFWQAVSINSVPQCICGSTVRPDVTFFGEGLPKRYTDHYFQDIKECDLLIVAGTSLVVYPFASLVNQVEPKTARLLINRDAVGVWKSYEEVESLREENYRDVALLGACDDGALQLVDLLGWRQDYENLNL
ncbi:hypothetical protein PROFUN_10415 [Planoprotostelium fungivorum]|uniref:Deacetylase sirtuin-type domain-containing protein n=1 Tax=Planoprotostelium fungivorum TaxID=1890364 RepID=A0A2P6NE19_9EUKA|nr:hypothetical protein PROFUN_10415 [Planoprotostelium fungivorum]